MPRLKSVYVRTTITVAFLVTFGCKPVDPDNVPTTNLFSDERVVALTLAAEAGDTKRIDQLIADGVDVNSKGLSHYTPLRRVFTTKNKDGYASLLRHGADPNIEDERGWTVLGLSTREPDVYWLKTALDHGGNPNLLSKAGSKVWQSRTPIFEAIAERRPENAIALIDAGANLDHRDSANNFPIGFADRFGQYEIVYVLIEKGADFRQKFSSGRDFTDVISEVAKDPRRGGIAPDQVPWFQKTINLLETKGVILPAQLK